MATFNSWRDWETCWRRSSGVMRLLVETGLVQTPALQYYREYTVQTPGATDRGDRRLITGQNGEMYYTEDHYNSFQEVI